ncbi:GNAT family N-acetyltransferase [Paraburkholderia youngii]|uniref:GNAT family N-acetyltransferase n=1 Tax=Paraburkholderia youngii TaxID=2782701 RepID=UPI003D205072
MVNIRECFPRAAARLLRRPQLRPPRIECRFDFVQDADGSWITAWSAHHHDKVGWLIMDPLRITETNYIRDMYVHEPLRGRGIGKALLKHAMSVCTYQRFGLVSVDRDALGFWCSVALDPAFDNRFNLGMTPDEVRFLDQYQRSFEKPLSPNHDEEAGTSLPR